MQKKCGGHVFCVCIPSSSLIGHRGALQSLCMKTCGLHQIPIQTLLCATTGPRHNPPLLPHSSSPFLHLRSLSSSSCSLVEQQET